MENEPTWYKDWVVTLMVGIVLVSMPAGILLALHFNDPSWLTITLIGFILVYAG